MFSDRVVVIENGERKAMYIKTSKCYELVAAVDDENKMWKALDIFLMAARTKERFNTLLNIYESSNTKLGITFKKANEYIDEKWVSIFRAKWNTPIQNHISKFFDMTPSRKKLIKKK